MTRCSKCGQDREAQEHRTKPGTPQFHPLTDHPFVPLETSASSLHFDAIENDLETIARSSAHALSHLREVRKAFDVVGPKDP